MFLLVQSSSTWSKKEREGAGEGAGEGVGEGAGEGAGADIEGAGKNAILLG